jgi:hypothetical protein
MSEERARIEEYPEIKVLLKALMREVDADAAILYKYVDTDDLEATELLELIEKTHIYSEGNLRELLSPGVNEMFEKVFSDYNEGSLKLDDTATKRNLDQIKESIRVLRFCDFTEKFPGKSRWKFDYDNRPRKYLVLSNAILSEQKGPDSQVQDEGVTALFCRFGGDKECLIGTNPSASSLDGGDTDDGAEVVPAKGSLVKHWLLSRDQLNVQRSHIKTIKEPGVYDVFNSHHAGWLLLLDDSGAPSGCIRFEYYDTSEPNFKVEIQPKFKKIAHRDINRLAVSIIDNVLEKKKQDSYDAKYHCLGPIIGRLQRIGIELKKRKAASATDGEWDKLIVIQNLVEHIFYVFKRNTYYGEAILERIKYFIKNVLKHLGLPEDIFSNIWNNLRKHEDLMLYGLDNYRDHLMHQFHVFITGYLIIYGLDVEKVRDLLNASYPAAMAPDKHRLSTGRFSKLDVISCFSNKIG